MPWLITVLCLWGLLPIRPLIPALIIMANPYASWKKWNEIGVLGSHGKALTKREDSPTDVCKRWSQQTAIVNGTLYIYGGRSISQSSQSDNTWNNDFLTIDLENDWDISSPKLTGLTKSSGPPAVANAYLWNSYTSLFLYGGEFSDNPPADPVEFTLWEYDIFSEKWTGHENPTTSKGKNSDDGDKPVQRSAEGAGITVSELGRGWYFGGHLDGYTTKGWSQSVARVYLKSMIEYTFPGFGNSQVEMEGNSKVAGADGIWRNITEGGLQDSAGFTERADGVLVYVPGFGEEGIIIGLGGGTNATFTSMNVIDIYDIANSTWYKQATSGKPPEIRVNPCAVAASAADGSSTQVYLYGGQNLIPYGEQKQYDDMWILTIPSFTWIKVDTDNQSAPPARAGHTCNIWNSQILVVGGYVGEDLSCDSPGIYVFDASELRWQTKYTALEGGNDLNQQDSQKNSKGGLSGSYGYKVPELVQSVIGGDSQGRATVTTPAVHVTEGPIATGKPMTYTVPDSTPTGGPGNNTQSPNSSDGGLNVAAIAAGVVACCLAILAAYLGFCTYVYRKQLALYKQHVAAAQRSSDGSRYGEKLSYLWPRENLSANGPSIGESSSALTMTPAAAAAHAFAASGYSRSAQPGSANSSADDLLAGQEPTFLGVMLNPRRSLRVINKD
ncbi:kelch repeat protein [Coccidioides immitis RS]|uniref:Kelch repeat protein n=1 Tax=Coccidioides immitis (strain RS) TaxID=246410 RepID=J3KCI1_COCIM|nr:kelch repeat protein [Coccidioides immitis RS]EAS32946.3 kelch repeat protein [Coccidioides immitis RS]